MQLSKHFSLEEMTRAMVAARKGIGAALKGGGRAFYKGGKV